MTTESDTPSAESSAPLSVNQAAAFFEPREDKPQETAPAKVETPETTTPEATQAEASTEKVEDAAAAPEKVTIEVDGKTVELTKAELADYYKNGLRQADYTRKTMETAEQRKAAEAETAKARDERARYAQQLQQNEFLLQAAMNEQRNIDWDALIRDNPQEALRQKHLLDSRQAALQQTRAQLGAIYQQSEAERHTSLEKHLQTEHQALLGKFPEWQKDEAKYTAETQAIAKFLIDDYGFAPEQVVMQRDPNTKRIVSPGITDHRLVRMAWEAMQFRQTMKKAGEAARKVENAPAKVERPGGGESNPLDGRTAAMKRLEKSGSIRDAAKLFEML